MNPPRPSKIPTEAPRDQEESAFTSILRRLFEEISGALAVVFVDDEGECVDYASALSPYDAKVNGAVLRLLADTASRELLESHGPVSMIQVIGHKRELTTRQVGEGYMLGVTATPKTAPHALLIEVERAVRQLRREASIPSPRDETFREAPLDEAFERPFLPVERSGDEVAVQVRIRRAIGWDYAPASFVEDGMETTVAHVLGRWAEGEGNARRLCFRVRTSGGIELTLVDDRAAKQWFCRRYRRRII